MDISSTLATLSTGGGDRPFPVRLSGRVLDMSVGALPAGATTSRHRHAHEALVYVVEGCGHTIIEGVRFDWIAGDVLYISPWSWHQHFAGDVTVRLLTATNVPQLEPR